MQRFSLYVHGLSASAQSTPDDHLFGRLANYASNEAAFRECDATHDGAVGEGCDTLAFAGEGPELDVAVVAATQYYASAEAHL